MLGMRACAIEFSLVSAVPVAATIVMHPESNRHHPFNLSKLLIIAAIHEIPLGKLA